jgi:hypothetical protein
MAFAADGPGQGFRGKVGGLSFYKMRGVDGTIVRNTSGNTKEKIQSDPNLDLIKRANSEFAGRSLASKYLRQALVRQKPMADYNIAGPLTALTKPVQALDTVSPFSKRNIILSAHPHFLKGFSLNKKNTFDSVIRYPVVATIDRETLSAKVQFPELMPGINFVPPVKNPYYSLRVTLGVMPDIVYREDRYEPVHRDYPENNLTYVDTPWFPLLKGSAALEVDIQHDQFPPDTNFTLVLAVGIRYGILTGIDEIAQAPYIGSAKVLEVG